MTIRLRSRLEALDRVDGKRPFEEIAQPGVLQLLLDRRRCGVGERHQSKSCLAQSLESAADVSMGGQRSHASKNGVSVPSRQRHAPCRGHHIERRTANHAEVGIGTRKARHVRIQQDGREPLAEQLPAAKRACEVRLEGVDVEHRFVDVEDDDPAHSRGGTPACPLGRTLWPESGNGHPGDGSNEDTT